MLESYVTPLLMSYVNRYIKNLKPSDLQLSLWGGDVVLSKLDLRLDVLEQELKLPFTFLSGHIHELRIHVPWTKLSSEAVVITINTMECILKLRDAATEDNESCTSSSTNRSESSKSVPKPRRVQQAPSDPDLPPGYVQSLIRRVVNNVNIVVNNLILKYVEDDIVLSVNITSAESYTVDDLWDRAFMDIISPELVLRKVINFSDCTVCLDRRNGSGKIEFYQDPLLYKCSFRTRLHFTYDNINAKIPAVIKVHTMVESLKLSLTDQQLPMFIRLMELGVALYYGEMGVHGDGDREENSSLRESVPGLTVEDSDPSLVVGQYFQSEDEDQGWVSWAWSFVPAIVSAEEEETEGESGGYTEEGGTSRPIQHSFKDPVVSVGFYCTKASVTFKLTESCSESSYYSPQKLKSREVLCVEQEGITVEALMMGEPFFDCQVGVVGCRAVCLKGIMGVRDFEENMNRREEDSVFFRCGETLSVKGLTYLTNSLFDYRSPENNGVKAEFILNGNIHKETYTEAAGLQRYGAFYMDYLFTMENSSSRVCVGLQDFSALRKDDTPLVQETSQKRIVIGPLDLQLHSSAVHRILKMAACTLDHEYQPYCKPQPDVVEECVSVGPEKVLALEEFIPTRQTSVMLMKARITVPAAEYNLLHVILPALLRHKVSTAQTSAPQFQLLRPLPALQLQCERVTFEHSAPMYEEEVTRAANSLNQPSETLLHNCYTHSYLKVFELQAGLTVIDSEGVFHPLLPIIPTFSTALYGKQLCLPVYWGRQSSVALYECMFELPQVCVQLTRAQVLLLNCMYRSWMYGVEGGPCSGISDALINHAYRPPGVKSVGAAPVLELCIQRVELKVCVLPALLCVSGTLGAVKVCARTPGVCEGQKEQLVSLVQGPSDTTDLHSSRWLNGSRKPASLLSPDLLQVSLQLPQHQHTLNAAVLLVSVQGIAVNLDPVLFSWLLFHPQRSSCSRPPQQVSMVMKKRREDEASVGSTPITKQPSNPASDYTSSPVKTKTHTESRPLSVPVKIFPSSEEKHLSSDEHTKNLITHTWNAVKHLTLQVELQSCCVFVPSDSLPSPSTLVCGDIPGTVRSWYHSQSQCMPRTLVLCLPEVSVTSAGHRRMEPLQDIPFTVPRPVLDEGDAFPWTVCVNQLSVYSLLGHQRSLSLLEPMGCTSTLALTSPKLQPDTKHTFIICLHVDLQPVHLKCSHPQVQLLYGLWCRWSQIASVVDQMHNRGTQKQSSGFPDPTGPPAGPSSPVHSSAGTIPPDTSTYSPSADLGSPTEGESVHTEDAVQCESMTLEQKTCTISSSSGKLSVWMQWMLPKLTFKLFSSDHTSRDNDVCVVAEMEDISASVDIQDVYTKVKCKVGSFHIDHYRSRRDSDSRSAEHRLCDGMILQCRETAVTTAKALEVSHQQHGFLSVTYTQAVTRNVRHKLTARQEHMSQRMCEDGADGSPQYLHEILLTAQPFDLVLSCPLLMTVSRVFHVTPPPHLRHPVRDRLSPGQPMRGHSLSSGSLPLIYVNTSVIRVFCPLEDMMSITHSQMKEDTVVLKIGSVSVAPQADNPLPRSVLRKDLYQRALNLGVLRDPGSEVEDRQYQIDLQSINMGTALWDDLRPERESSTGGCPPDGERNSQNPALEWNMASRIRRHQEKRVILSPIITDFSVRITAGPAIIYRKPLAAAHGATEEVVVCGHSLEMNVTSSLELYLSVSQVQLLRRLLQANVGLTAVNQTPADVRGQQLQAAAGSGSVESLCGSIAPGGQDSGFGSDSARLRFVGMEHQGGTGQQHRLARTSHQPAITKNLSFIPFDVFLTAGRISLMTYATAPSTKPPADGPQGGKSALDRPEDEASDGGMSSLTADDLLYGNTAVSSSGVLEGVSMPSRVSARQALGVTVVRQPGRRGDKDCSLEPLMFLQVTQPSLLINCHHRKQKLELSLFDLTLKAVESDYKSLDAGKSLPESLDYSVFWLQTLAGEADSRTGIPPPLLSVIIKDFLTGPELKVDVSRPLRLSPTLAKVEQAKNFWKRIFPESEGDGKPGSSAGSGQCCDSNAPLTLELMLRSLQTLVPLHKISLRAVQLAVAVELEGHTSRPALMLSVSGMMGTLTLKNALRSADGFKEVCVSLQCDDVLVRTALKDRSVVFLGPFSCTSHLEAYWCRHSRSSTPDSPAPPRVLIDLKGGLLQVFWGQLQFNCLSYIHDHLLNYCSQMTRVEAESNEKPLLSTPPPPTHPVQSEHSSDDLRTGLFQYIQDSASQKLPSAHEVVFWKETEDSPGVMLWRYPEPRIITFLRITPVPFNTTDDPDISTADLGDVLQVPCSLEYWDELQRVFVPYREFSLSESCVCELTLPSLTPDTHQTDLVTSDLWRVVLNSSGDGGDESSDSEWGSQCDQLVCPTALAACSRVDSCFAPCFVPSMGVSIRLAYLELRFCHNLDQLGTVLCKRLRPFLPDRKLPQDQEFAVLHVCDPCVFVRQWSDVTQQCHEFRFSSTLSCRLLEYRNLTRLPIIQPVNLQGQATHTLTHTQHTLSCSTTLQPLHAAVGQYAIHTLDRALQAWRQNRVPDAEELIFSHYVICNDTQEVLRFGQVDTDENILLHSNQSHQYSWRTHKSPQLLHICMEGWGNWRWAEPFSVDDVGTLLRTIQHKGQTASLIITVKPLNGVQKQVIISGRQVMCSFLSQSIDLRLVQHHSGQDGQVVLRERVARLEADSKLPSLVLEDAELTQLCVRLCGDDVWSQDVCLEHKNNSSVLQVPCSDGSLLHVWCTTILLEANTHMQQTLVVFSPLFMMWSHLSEALLVHIEKRSLGHKYTQLIHGGGHQEALLNVEADLIHHLTFQASEDDVSDCAVPVSTAVIKQIISRSTADQKQHNLLHHFYGEKTAQHPAWPYTCKDTHRCVQQCESGVVQWDSPMQVRLSVWRWGLNTLMVEVVPWALLLNRSHWDLWLFEAENIITQIPAGKTITPPNFKDAFQIGIYWPQTNTVHKSPAVRLVHEVSSPRWPEGGGADVLLLDEDGYIHTDITLGTQPGKLKLCQLCVSSSVKYGIQVLQIEDKTVLLNNTTNVIKCRAVMSQQPNTAHDQVYRVPESSVFALNPAAHVEDDQVCCPVACWDVQRPVSSAEMRSEVDVPPMMSRQLLLSCEGDAWSLPALIRPDFPRQSVCVPVTPGDTHPFSTRALVVTCQEHQGITYVAVSEDLCPRMLIHNRCPMNILLKENLRECPRAEVFCRMLPAVSSVHHELYHHTSNFPECKQKDTLPTLLLCLIMDTPTDPIATPIIPTDTPITLSWTDAIDISSPGTQVVFLPGFGCLYIDVLHQSGTITLTLAPESHAEDLVTHHRLSNPLLSFRILLNEVSVALCDDITTPSSSVELLRLTLSKVLLHLPPNEPSAGDVEAPPTHRVQVHCSGLQVDNQLYNRASFHFPVIVCQEPQTDAAVCTCDPSVPLAPHGFCEACFLSLSVSVSADGQLDQLAFRVQPARVYLEDTFIYYMKTLFHTYIPESTLGERGSGQSRGTEVPGELLESMRALEMPVRLQKLSIEAVHLLVSIHASLKLYIASDHTPLSFSLFERGPICTTPRHLVHTLALHYAAGALFRAGWVVGSLEILGSPASLVRSIGNGVSDFFRLPYEGLTRGPGAFISGVSRGTNSFIKHISKGTLTSITNLATSLARNMDRLSLDDEHFMRQEEWRRQLPETLGDGLRQGLSRLGISLLGAIAGIVDQPMQTFTRTLEMPDSASSAARGVISGVGKGIVGVFTKPIGGAAELVSQTGYGLLHGAGLWQLPQPLHLPTDRKSADAVNSHVKYIWKMLQSLGRAELHMALEVCMVSGSGQEHSGCLLLSGEVLFVVSVCEDAQQQAFPITEIQCEHDTHTPGRITLTLQQHRVASDTEGDGGGRESLSELQYKRLVDFVTGASQYLTLSAASLSHQTFISPVEPPPTATKTYHYQADPAFAQVFICKFTMVKNKALRIGFH
ncbi:intermembrane lipid transfer protein VPS13B-like isoform X2 [Triplophysa dalaica]|uniref:intermembrane lipid transfer protein VPS13B-like isoform X2 n=1 Tax=Triplophysa dalaica TaxID=1582913 RepID=UPI0024DF9219|nr:intermembrane lipid transfer protein VPS13B-like isoform X2 [Triplophysa dalaica]